MSTGDRVGGVVDWGFVQYINRRGLGGFALNTVRKLWLTTALLISLDNPELLRRALLDR